MEQHYRRLRRHTTARSVFDWIALVCLCSSIAFWLTLHIAWLAPPAVLSMQSIVAVVMGLIYALVTPLLWSAMAPSTPAGMMLQRTQTRTWGFVVMVGATGFLTWHGWRLIWSWWMAQPNVAETGEAVSLAVACLIGFVVVPALAWTATTPEQWMAAIEQAHAVRKLEMQQKGELAIIKASLIRAETLAAIGWANLLPLEKDEAIAMQRGLLMAASDNMRAVVKTLGLDAELSRSIMNDEEIASQLDYVKSAIDVVPQIAPVARQEETRALAHTPARANGPSERAERAPAPYTEPHKGRDDNRVALTHRDTARDGDYTIAYEAFGTFQAWTVRDLAGVLKVAESTARERKIAWELDDIVSGVGQPNGRYRFIA